MKDRTMKSPSQVYAELFEDHAALIEEDKASPRDWRNLQIAEARGRLDGFVRYFATMIGDTNKEAKAHLERIRKINS